MKKVLFAVLLTFGVSALDLLAQGGDDAQQPSNTRQPHQGGPQSNGQGGGQGGARANRNPPPIIAALDGNHDGVIDAQEIANAPSALRTLDKNDDGQLTKDEIRPSRQGDQQGNHRGQGQQPPEPPPDE